MLKVPQSWAWDFWLADDGESFHLYFLNAPTALGDADRRHRQARIGHAVSTDLSSWELHDQVFGVGSAGAFDDTATWTGCVVRGDDGLWRMFYTGARFLHKEPHGANIEAIGVAVSHDLKVWEKLPGPVVQADPRWYETYGTSEWREEAWRDPWVFRDPDGAGWHMLITARANHGPLNDRGVIGHAYSTDLETWEVRAPLSAPGSGFAQLEVPQLENIDGQWTLLFSCPASTLSDSHPERDSDPGSWALPVDNPVARYNVADASPITRSNLYSARIIRQRDGTWALLGFDNAGSHDPFPGTICDPIPVTLDQDGRLLLA